MLTRRNFIQFSLGASAALAFPEIGSAAGPDWRAQALNRDRNLSLIRPDSKEKATLCYWTQRGGWNVDGYRQACWLLRDVKYSAAVNMDTGLLDTLFIMQMWLATYGQKHDIHVLSGYRTAHHNSTLEGAAKNSMHLYGRASDIYMPGVSPVLLANMGKMLGLGGVGLYAKRGFIHVDKGSVRSWSS
ncbi:YcbK family protein [Pseudomonas sp. GXZC]|uniref:YcbK family protein n=1 Tax=Pseudomonas sp. GXZC TaxID=3003351 RepID=UPI0022A9F8FC|nr:DUF882 domain-containing protein [Pseudomonas sp. GXZC]WAT32161.1 DUF882 domain-containing protein [Pseudomonas sp. GXZC]WAT32197.1 DUF882 domain-containing protein [Pseudomonas sp. GXZC]